MVLIMMVIMINNNEIEILLKVGTLKSLVIMENDFFFFLTCDYVRKYIENNVLKSNNYL